MMKSLKLNRSFQALMGLGLLLMGWRLWTTSFFSTMVQAFANPEVYSEQSGFSGIASTALSYLAPLLFDTLCLLGIVFISAISMGWRVATPIVKWAYVSVTERIETATGIDLPFNDTKPEVEQERRLVVEDVADTHAMENELHVELDPVMVSNALNDIISRLEALEAAPMKNDKESGNV